ncbi:DUF1272 domain-containing protein [Nocardia sp. NPDC059091]
MADPLTSGGVPRCSYSGCCGESCSGTMDYICTNGGGELVARPQRFE